MLRSSVIKSNDSEDLPKIPIALIERLTNLILIIMYDNLVRSIKYGV